MAKTAKEEREKKEKEGKGPHTEEKP